MRVRVQRRDPRRRGSTSPGVLTGGVLAGCLLVVMMVSAGCSPENPGTVARSTTTRPSSASTILTPYTGLAAENPRLAACALLADTVGLDGLVPVDSSSWRDERERILVDAQRESTLLPLAAPGASPELTPALQMLADHAARVAEEISQATDHADAMDRLGSMGSATDLRAAADAVADWRHANC